MVPTILLLVWNIIMAVNTTSKTYTCPHEDGLFYATNEDCKFYYRCKNEVLRTGICFPWQKFDVHTVTCRKIKEVDCNSEYAGVWRPIYEKVPEPNSVTSQVLGEEMLQKTTLQGNKTIGNKSSNEENRVGNIPKQEKVEWEINKIIYKQILNYLLHIKIRNKSIILKNNNIENITVEKEIEHKILRKRQININKTFLEKQLEDKSVSFVGNKEISNLHEQFPEVQKEIDGSRGTVNSEVTASKAEVYPSTDNKQQQLTAGYWYWCGSGRYVFTTDIGEGSSICLNLQDPESTDREDSTQQGEGTGHTYIGSNAYH
ncbi:uncharacterized protein LOC124361507 [Homalodisca vitripennis]|uniref:uncharacterized protein LOC124361507 n=1 Tax=Homalodisca vitripennis TaxID=197043 RepID=UPI001EE9E562|nr:uncharacterized protein LOC124361507 [Homalodisca vitripennis]